MNTNHLQERCRSHLAYLCHGFGSRRVGTPGNRAANAFLAVTLKGLGWEVECTQFPCLDWERGDIQLEAGGLRWPAHVGPYSPGCEVQATLVVADRVERLEELDDSGAGGKILLVKGDLAAEPLMPKGYPFYNPEEHQRIVGALERCAPAAIVAATGRHPGLAGGAYPFPLIEDGNFDLPTAYLTDAEGEKLAAHAGATARLSMSARRVAATGGNLVARRGPADRPHLTFSAHIDAKDDTPGALDNAAGVATLLLLAELLGDVEPDPAVELVFFNGEDHYSAAGELAYLRSRPQGLPDVIVDINIDAAGYREGRTAWSLYGCPEPLAGAVRSSLAKRPELYEGDPWYQGDHGVFMQAGRPAIAITSEQFVWLTEEITHTAKDRPELVDCGKLAVLAEALAELHADLGAAGVR